MIKVWVLHDEMDNDVEVYATEKGVYSRASEIIATGLDDPDMPDENDKEFANDLRAAVRNQDLKRMKELVDGYNQGQAQRKEEEGGDVTRVFIHERKVHD